jgi:branched-chain amino acid transport system permease protein
MHILGQAIISGIVVGSFYALMAIALQLSYAGTKVLNFAQGDLVVVGSFLLYSLITAHVNQWVAFVLLVPAGFVIGAIFEVIFVQPFLKRSLLESALATLGGALILEGILLEFYGPSARAIPAFIAGEWHSPLGIITYQSIFSLIISLVVIGGGAVLASGRWGLVIRANADNPYAATLLGVSSRRAAIIAFGLGGAISALAGGLLIAVNGPSFDSGQQYILTAFTAALLGGLGNIGASAVGGLALGFIGALVQLTGIANYSFTITWGILLAVLLLRPSGLLGRAELT